MKKERYNVKIVANIELLIKVKYTKQDLRYKDKCVSKRFKKNNIDVPLTLERLNGILLRYIDEGWKDSLETFFNDFYH